MIEITVNEALQLKNQLESEMQKVERALTYANVCQTFEQGSGTDVTDATKALLPDALLDYSDVCTKYSLVNDALNIFTATSGLSKLVFKIKVVKKVIERLERALDEAVQRVTRQNGMSGGQPVVVTFSVVPVVTKADLKERLKGYKKQVRALQGEVFVLNAQKISIEGLEQSDL